MDNLDNVIGKRLDGRYLLESLVGVGGMANVYKALDLKEQRTVAVKILRPEFMENEELVRRFKNESKAISILDHPHIVKVYDVSVNDKLQYIVMEYIDGITLKEYMNQRGGPLTWKEAVHFITQILETLDHAHRKGVVHRDVKPQNIMLLADGSIKMMDFGIARFSRAESQLVSEKAIGSVHYISPEQAKGDVTDAKADIYSTGVMLYEMLAGRLPFESDSAVSVAIKQISDEPVPLAQAAPEVPEGLQAITARAMAKDPAGRYPSARAMLDDLEEFKKNPSIRFEYQYMTDTAPARYIDKAMKQTKNGGAAPPQRSSQGGKQPAPRKRKKRRSYTLPILAGMALAFAIGSGILCYMIFTNSTNPLFSNRDDVELVNFVGMTRDEIEANEEYNKNFDIHFVEEYNDKYPAGQVFSQTPRPPRQVKERQAVTLKVSLGTQMITVKDVTNMVQKNAEEVLREQGFTVSIYPVEDKNFAVGTVIRTDPEANTQAAAGSTIMLFVSQDKVDTNTEVPMLVGLSIEDANVALTNKILVMGNRTEAYSSEYEAGIIIDQTPEAGTKLKWNSKVNVVVSLGPEPTPEPSATPEPSNTPTAPPATPEPVPTPTTAPTSDPGSKSDPNANPDTGG